MDEFFEALVLIQTLKQAFFPIILIGSEFWTGLIDWIKDQMLRHHQYISPDDLDFFQIVDDPDKAVSIIKEFREEQGGRTGLDLPAGMKTEKA